MAPPSSEVRSSKIKITDFGQAFELADPPMRLATPKAYSPPELAFEEKASASADIWTLACTCYEILGAHSLFFSFLGSRDDVLEEMVDTLGIFPKRWWDLWPQRDQRFTKDGLKRKGSPKSLRLRVRDMGRGMDAKYPDFSAEEKAALEQLLHSMLRYEPSEQVSAQEVLYSELMQRWCISEW